MLSDNQNNKLSALQLLLNAKFSNSADSVGSHRIVENERERERDDSHTKMSVLSAADG